MGTTAHTTLRDKKPSASYVTSPKQEVHKTILANCHATSCSFGGLPYCRQAPNYVSMMKVNNYCTPSFISSITRVPLEEALPFRTTHGKAILPYLVCSFCCACLLLLLGTLVQTHHEERHRNSKKYLKSTFFAIQNRKRY